MLIRLVSPDRVGVCLSDDWPGVCFSGARNKPATFPSRRFQMFENLLRKKEDDKTKTTGKQAMISNMSRSPRRQEITKSQ